MAKLQRILLFLMLLPFLIPIDAAAEKIVFVSSGQFAPWGQPWDQEWVDLLTQQGYEVERQDDTMKGVPLNDEQIDILESADLIIVSRALSSGDYNDPAGWNSISKPLILFSAYLSRASRWQWLMDSNLLGDGNSGAPLMYVDKPDHPLFAGVTLGENNQLEFLDAEVGSGHTSLCNTPDAGNGEVIASTAEFGTPWIIYWPAGVFFHDMTDQTAGGKRLLLQCATRESTLSPPNPDHGWGMFNLTPEGTKVYLNAVAWMLGKEVQVDQKPTAPAAFALAQNYPNPFNPQTTVEFTLMRTARISLRIFDVNGREVACLADGEFAAGTHQITWNAGNLESGVYFYKLETPNFQAVKKMTLLK
ncbi:MAG: T9SS type A sorting domain-containing protein [candidate division KSB1 bacterium]|nr:T9SS type A sorting domain-containing protein [candidate division KSB1 bacterium]